MRLPAFLLLLSLPLACSGPTLEELSLQDFERAEALYAEGGFQEAIPLYESVLVRRDGIVDAHLHLALCYDEVGRLNDAVALLERFDLLVRRNHPAALPHLASLYERTGRLPEAAKKYRLLADQKGPESVDFRRKAEQLERTTAP